jgi:hypothetical protein
VRTERFDYNNQTEFPQTQARAQSPVVL